MSMSPKTSFIPSRVLMMWCGPSKRIMVVLSGIFVRFSNRVFLCPDFFRRITDKQEFIRRKTGSSQSCNCAGCSRKRFNLNSLTNALSDQFWNRDRRLSGCLRPKLKRYLIRLLKRQLLPGFFVIRFVHNTKLIEAFYSLGTKLERAKCPFSCVFAGNYINFL